MDRIWLIVLTLAGAIAVGLPMPGESWPPAGDASLARVPDPTPSAIRTEQDGGERSPAPEQTAEAASCEEAVGLVLDRLAMRHTALSARERRALAETIVREARAHDLDPDLVMGVIEVESAGYALAVSHVGAMGLMQLLPSTAEELADRLGIAWKGPDTLFDPQINVRLGTAYLRELHDRYDGNANIALAAYNWGPGRIDRRLRRGATVPSRYIEQVRSAVDRYASIVPTRS